jgi:hypothetical protein
MNSRVLLAVLLVLTIVGLSNSSANDAMTKFKKSLSPEDQALVKSHTSKSRYIQSLLERSKGVDKRDKADEFDADKREVSDADEPACCSCNPGATGCFHPRDVKRSRIIRCCIPHVSETEKREQDDDVLDSLSPEDQQLMQKHRSKIHNLAMAQNKHVNTADNDNNVNNKRQQTDDGVETTAEQDKVLDEAQENALQHVIDQLGALKDAIADMKQQHEAENEQKDTEIPSASADEDVTGRFLEDISLAKKHGINLHDLLTRLAKRAESQKKH